MFWSFSYLVCGCLLQLVLLRRRSEAFKERGIVVLRHELSVLRRQARRPQLTMACAPFTRDLPLTRRLNRPDRHRSIPTGCASGRKAATWVGSLQESHGVELHHEREVVGNDFDRGYSAVTDREDVDDANFERACCRFDRPERRLEAAGMTTALQEREHESIAAFNLLEWLDLQVAERSLQHPRSGDKFREADVDPVDPYGIGIRLAEGG